MPVLSVSSVLFGLMTLFIDPNPGDPLNKEAANHMMDKPDDFERVVRSTLRGGSYKGRSYPRLV
jgi:ubiquitin-conjugating enzyme E2 M